jgi:hypothetical protein
MNEMMNLNRANIPTFNSKRLQTATDKIFSLGEKIRRNALETCAIIATVEAEKSYETDGFKSVHEWTAEAFGFKKSTSYNMLNIGRDYIKPIKNEKGRITGYASIIASDEGDYTVTQLRTLLPIGKDGAVELAESKKITPDMSTRAMKEVVDEYKASMDEDEAEASKDEAEASKDEGKASKDEGKASKATEAEDEPERMTADVDIDGDTVTIYFGGCVYEFTAAELVKHMK